MLKVADTVARGDDNNFTPLTTTTTATSYAVVPTPSFPGQASVPLNMTMPIGQATASLSNHAVQPPLMATASILGINPRLASSKTVFAEEETKLLGNFLNDAVTRLEKDEENGLRFKYMGRGERLALQKLLPAQKHVVHNYDSRLAKAYFFYNNENFCSADQKKIGVLMALDAIVNHLKSLNRQTQKRYYPLPKGFPTSPSLEDMLRDEKIVISEEISAKLKELYPTSSSAPAAMATTASNAMTPNAVKALPLHSLVSQPPQGSTTTSSNPNANANSTSSSSTPSSVVGVRQVM